MAENDESAVPDLEDCSHLVKQWFKPVQSDASSDIQITVAADASEKNVPESAHQTTVELTGTESKAKPAEQKSQFCGLKKGFLLQPKSKASGVKEPLPFIAKSAEKQNPSLVIEEVQQCLTDKKSEWLNDDLLKTLENSDDNFLSMMTNPEFGAVLAEFQRNPQQATQKYQNNKTIMGFFTKFAQIMGDHFTKLGAKKS